MAEIIKLTNGNPVVDSLTIAAGVQVQHKNIVELTRKYLSDFQAFGWVAFETQPFETKGGIQKREVALFNENQAMLLFTYLKNTEIARTFKIRLVQAFSDCRDELARTRTAALALPDFTNPAIAARAWAEQFEQRQVAESKAFALANQIQADKPKIDLADKFLDSTGDFIIRMVAKALGVGVMKLYDWMREKKLISKTNEPYAGFCTRGILRPIPHYHEGSNGERKCRLTTHVTSKGVFYLHQRLIKDGLIPTGKQIDFEYLIQEAA